MDAAARPVVEPTRREILHLLRHDERTVSDIAEHFDTTRPATSQHQRALAELTEWMAGFWTSSLRSLAIEVEREQWNARKQQQRKSKR